MLDRRAALALATVRREPLLQGDELAAELEIATGPRVGELLAGAGRAQYAGEITTREEALAYRARALRRIPIRLRSSGRPGLHLLQDHRGRVARDDRRRGRAHDLLHGHQPCDPGHALVIPRTHAEDLLSIEADDLQAVVLAAQRLAVRGKERLEADGVNLINSCGARAWQTVFHFHMHVIPRYQRSAAAAMDADAGRSGRSRPRRRNSRGK